MSKNQPAMVFFPERFEKFLGRLTESNEGVWVLKQNEKKFYLKNKVRHVPGLIRLFEEIMLNLIEKFRKSDKFSLIQLHIDRKNRSIEIFLNGRGITVEIDPEKNIYVPDLLFGVPSDINEDYWLNLTPFELCMKIANSLSSQFKVEVRDSISERRYVHEYLKNATESGRQDNYHQPSNEFDINDFTKITWTPDPVYFNIDNEMIEVIQKKLWDLAATSYGSFRILLDGDEIKLKSFREYVEMFIPAEKNQNFFYDIYNENLEVGLTEAPSFQNISFVNGISVKGGRHVEYLSKIITERIHGEITKNKDVQMNPHIIKKNLFIFINLKIENPEFNARSKDFLMTNFGAYAKQVNFTLSDNFFNHIFNSNLYKELAKFAVKTIQSLAIKPKAPIETFRKPRSFFDGKIKDAHESNSRNGKCTLLITEAGNKESFGLKLQEQLGRDTYGVYPIDGIPNVRILPKSRVMHSRFMHDLTSTIGLKYDTDYSYSIKTLRYSKIVIIFDVDSSEASTKKALILSLFQFFWPSLLKRNNFLKEFIPPKFGVMNFAEKKFFSNMQELTNWQKSNESDFSTEDIQQYYGLGTFKEEEIREIARQFSNFLYPFHFHNKEDEEAIINTFNVKKPWYVQLRERAEQQSQQSQQSEIASGKDVKSIPTYSDNPRPERPLLTNQNPDRTLGVTRIKDFLEIDYKQSQLNETSKTINSLLDGLKIADRKILYSCFLLKLKEKKIKVTELSAYTILNTAPASTELSICTSMVHLAQDYLGKHNINLLVPEGQFGNRYTRSPGPFRQLYTSLNPLARILYREEDDPILMYNVDGEKKIEPIYFMPVIPVVLINCNWRYDRPKYNPKEVAENIIRKLNNLEYNEMKPWFQGFTGTVEDMGSPYGFHLYEVRGSVLIVDNEEEVRCIDITEIPVNYAIKDYVVFLKKHMVENRNKLNIKGRHHELEIEEIREYHIGNSVYFRLKLTPTSFNKICDCSNEERLRILKLIFQVNCDLTILDQDNNIQTFANPYEVLDHFIALRWAYYTKRKNYYLSKHLYDIEVNENIIKFLQETSNDLLRYINMSFDEKVSYFKNLELATVSALKDKYPTIFRHNTIDPIAVETNTSPDKEYEYILKLGFDSFKIEEISKLENHIMKCRSDLINLHPVEEKDLWISDLNDFIVAYEESVRKSEITAIHIEQNRRNFMDYEKISTLIPEGHPDLAVWIPLDWKWSILH